MMSSTCRQLKSSLTSPWWHLNAATGRRNKSAKTSPRIKDDSVFNPSNRPRIKLIDSKTGFLRPSTRNACRHVQHIVIPAEITVAIDDMIHREWAQTTVDGAGAGNSLHELLRMYMEAGVQLERHLMKRMLPVGTSETERMIKEMQHALLANNQTYIESAPDADLTAIEVNAQREAEARINNQVYNWQPVEFDVTTSRAHLLGRTSFEYASMAAALREIKKRNKNFRPRTMLDYATTTGSAIWATMHTFHHQSHKRTTELSAQEYDSRLVEVMAIDDSPDMLNICRSVLSHADTFANVNRTAVFFRNNLSTVHPSAERDVTERTSAAAESRRRYDIVTCGHALLLQPNTLSRLQLVEELWRSTDRYLVIVENGTNAGFSAIAEARDFLIQLSQMAAFTDAEKTDIHGHVFAPCPHQSGCPRYTLDTVPCNFDVRYTPYLPSILRGCENSVMQSGEPVKARFSYVIFRKGERIPPVQSTYPRLVHEPIRNTGHAICRVCTSAGRLEEVVLGRQPRVDDDANNEEIAEAVRNAKRLRWYAERIHCGDQMRVRLESDNVYAQVDGDVYDYCTADDDSNDEYD